MCFWWSEKSKRASGDYVLENTELIIRPSFGAGLSPRSERPWWRYSLWLPVNCGIFVKKRMKYASAAVRSDTTNSDSCHCSLFLPPSVVSGILSGCYSYCFEPVRQQNAKPSFAETKMSEQHFRRVAEPELSRFHSLSFKRLQLLTKFSATGNSSVPSSFSLPVSRSAGFKLTFSSHSVQAVSCVWRLCYCRQLSSASSLRCTRTLSLQMQFRSLREIFSWFDSGCSGPNVERVAVVIAWDGMLGM